MSRKKKSSHKNDDNLLHTIILVTAILNTIKSVIDLIKSLSG